ncbi:MAG: hypothetical protein NWF00_04860 [Candidatus Bathyarchaeota archaeon]|nr:hypothetical protein [Candidatus Bathyarchaeota archaeon]
MSNQQRMVNLETQQRVILAELARGPFSRKDLLGQVLQKGVSPASFDVTFRYLRSRGRIRKETSAKRAPWVITEKGRKMLEALS